MMIIRYLVAKMNQQVNNSLGRISKIFDEHINEIVEKYDIENTKENREFLFSILDSLAQSISCEQL